MGSKETIYILGSGAIGFPLAAYLANAGKTVVAVRTSRKDVPKGIVTVTVYNGANRISTPVETISLSRLASLDGTIVITTKSYANQAIALELKDKAATGPIVIMQNGVGVEKPFLEAHFSPIYRGILYVTSQATSEYDFTFRPVTSSPIGIVNGNESGLKQCVEDLTTDGFPFRSEANIQREIWKKAIINSVFNSICPLLDVDNGVFVRDEGTANLAREVVRECVTLTDRLNLGLSESELMAQIMRISQGSDGQLISTLQDIRSGRQTEIEFLNLEIARVAASMQPGLHLPRVELLGKMILAKSLQQRERNRMTENLLVKLFEHNNWANLQIIQACSALSDEQLDAEPQSATKGSIRHTLSHLVASQQGYLSLLTLPVEARLDVRPTFAELQESARISGEGLLALARDESSKPMKTQLRTMDGYLVEPWVVMVQAINHATEHREQIKSMLSALGVTPPDLDGWTYGEVTGALIPVST